MSNGLDSVTQRRIQLLQEQGYHLFHDISFDGNGKIAVRYIKDFDTICEVSSRCNSNYDRYDMQDLANTLTRYVTRLAWVHCHNEGYTDETIS